MSDPVFEDVETYCSLKRSRPVVLSLRVESVAKGKLVSGFAVSCDCELAASKVYIASLGNELQRGENENDWF